MKKQKRSQKLLSYIFIGIFIATLIGIGSLLLIVALPSESDYSNRSQATAQFLEQHPAQIPNFIRVDEQCNDDATHCFWIMPDMLRNSNDAQNEINLQETAFILTIDGQVHANFQVRWIDALLYGDLDLAPFGSGLHLIEVQIQAEDGHIYQHAWSVRSEAGVVSAPPTLAVPPTYSTAVPDVGD